MATPERIPVAHLRTAEDTAGAVRHFVNLITLRANDRGLTSWTNDVSDPVTGAPMMLVAIGPVGWSPVTSPKEEAYVRAGVPLTTQDGLSYLCCLAAMLGEHGVPIEAVHAAACMATELQVSAILGRPMKPSAARAPAPEGHRTPRRAAPLRGRASSRPRR
jgi:hypothetical protein